jgi:hypothetical protein
MRTLEIVHRTRNEYSEPVSLGDHRLMCRPRDSHDLRLLRTGLVIDPAAQVRWIHDPFGNSIAIASFEGKTQVLELVSTIQLEHFVVPPGAGHADQGHIHRIVRGYDQCLGRRPGPYTYSCARCRYGGSAGAGVVAGPGAAAGASGGSAT